jgi:hypothetical protein
MKTGFTGLIQKTIFGQPDVLILSSLNPVNSLLKNASSHRRKPVSRITALIESRAYWIPAPDSVIPGQAFAPE